MEGSYQLAEKKIHIETLYADSHRLLWDYRAEGDVDFSVSTTQIDIETERRKSAREDELAGNPVRVYSDGYLETLAVYRKIAERMPGYDTFLFHGSCVAVDGEGYLFTAKSGTGKSTHTRLWRELLGDRAVMVNDDKPLIRVNEDGTAVAFGTPWDGKHHLSNNVSVPLRAICILERAEQNAIRPISGSEAYPMLLQQAYRPMDGMALNRTLTLIDKLAAAIRLWRLGCNRDMEAAQIAYGTMSGP